MELLNNKHKEDLIKRTEIEQVVREQKELTLLGKYNVAPGFKLYCYNPANGDIKEVNIKRGNIIQIELTTEGWIYFDPEMASVTIDSRVDYFQAFNLTSAINMVSKLKAGKIKYLFNLKKHNPGGIDFFKPYYEKNN